MILTIGYLTVLPITAFTTDEGSVVLQARHLEKTGTWLTPVPPAQLDPDGSAALIYRSDRGTEGRAFYAKHPLYPLIVAGADSLLQRSGMMLLSTAGGIGAALVAALLARRLRDDLAVPCFWITGLASPLFFDSYLVVAHTLAALCVAGGALCVWRGLQSPSGVPWWTAAGGVLLSIAALLRTEAIFALPAIVVALVWVLMLSGRRNRSDLRRAIVQVVLLAVPYVILLGGERLVVQAILGDPLPGPPGESFGYLADRVIAARATWIAPSMAWSLPDVAVLAAAVLAIVAGYVQRKGRWRLVTVLWVGIAFLWLIRVITGPYSVIPGLLMAFPLMAFGLLCLSGKHLESELARFLGISATLITLCVFATQYSEGGGVEWGGRYFALVLPLVTPLLTMAVVDAISSADSMQWRRMLAGAVVMTSVCTMCLAVVTLRNQHRVSAQYEEVVSSAVAEFSKASPAAPYVLSTDLLLPQLLWDGVDPTRWLLAPLPKVPSRLHDLTVKGERSVIVATSEPRELEAALPPGWRLIERRSGPLTSTQVFLLEAR